MVLMLFLVNASETVLAQSYPAKPIKLIVPFAPGGGTDIVARILAQNLSESLGQPVVVDNRAGADGRIGTQMIVRAAPDGYTIGMAAPGPLTLGRALYDLPYDPGKDVVPVILTNEIPILLLLHPSIPVRRIAERECGATQGPVEPGLDLYFRQCSMRPSV